MTALVRMDIPPKGNVVSEPITGMPKGAIIVMDNATFHKRHDIIKVINDCGCQIEFLPAYSPDLNPIEKMGSGQSD